MGGRTDGLDIFGNPQIALPEDIGDGPFAGPATEGTPNFDRMASTTRTFKRTEPFEDNWITDNAILGPSEQIIVGEISVNDTVPRNSYRRVHQHISLNYTSSVGGFPIIRFIGNPCAIIEEGVGMLAPTPKPATSAPPDRGPTSMDRAMDSISAVNEFARPTMSIQTSSYKIRFRMPGYEHGRFTGVVAPRDIMTINPMLPHDAPLNRTNQIEEFFFSNSGSSQRVFRIDYPVGDVVPIIFDIVNHNPIYAISVALRVSVLMYRGEEG